MIEQMPSDKNRPLLWIDLEQEAVKRIDDLDLMFLPQTTLQTRVSIFFYTIRIFVNGQKTVGVI